MCFANDCEWFASVVNNKSGADGPATKCDECGAGIPVGAWRFWIYMQENEDEACECCGSGVLEDGEPCDECGATSERGRGLRVLNDQFYIDDLQWEL